MESDLNPAPFITGIGLVTPLGQTALETWTALLAGGSIVNHARVPGFTGSNRASAMALAAAKEALHQARWSDDIRRQPDSALFVGTSKGEIESWSIPGDPALMCGLSQIDVDLARALNFGPGPRMTLSSACSSGLHALIRAAMAIQSREARRALVVAVEASVQPLFISSFNRLGVLAPEGHGCRPFDTDRAGFIITEAAAAICVETPEKAVGRSQIRIAHYALAGDGTHLTSGDPDAKAMRALLACFADRDFDLIHAHGTATQINDPCELAAIQTITGDSHPVLYSHKAALGHSLGGAGLVSIVLNCLCHQHGKVPPNIRSTRPLPMNELRFPAQQIETPIHRSLALAAGFGGPIAAVSLESV